jgi:hypothetical protein
VAITRRRPPHRGHASTSMSNARPHQMRPRPRPRGRRCRLVIRTGGRGRGHRHLNRRGAVGDHPRAPARMRREDPDPRRNSCLDSSSRVLLRADPPLHHRAGNASRQRR